MLTEPNSLTRRGFIAKSVQAAAVGVISSTWAQPTGPKIGATFSSERRDIRDPDTGRRVIQLTSGTCFDMPMYYFEPTFGSDGKTIVFYRYDHVSGEIQLYKTHVDSGATARLTNATTKNSLWRPYMQAPGYGVRDLMSAVNPVTDEAIYFNGNEIHGVHLSTFADRLIAKVPEGRAPSGLTGVSPNGRYFCYAYYDQKWHDAQLPPATTPPDRWLPQDSRVVIVDLRSGETRELIRVNFWITHTNFIDDNHVVFCHNATDKAICVIDVRRPFQYDVIRTENESGGTNHYSISPSGSLMYEIMSPRTTPLGVGFYDLKTRTRREYKIKLTRDHGRIHIGRDPDNKRCFFESGQEGGGQILTYFPRLEQGKVNPGMKLIGPSYSTFSNNQRSHFHPSVTPDRKWILFTGGDQRNKTNHLFMVDISDLSETSIQA